MPRLASVLFLSLLFATGACDDGVSSASRLRRLRLLAVQAEPPNPAFGTTTRLRPLVYVPPGESVTYAWSWCPVPTRSEDGYLCPVDQAVVDQMAVLAGLAGIPPLFLGTTESIAFTNPFPAALLASLCAGDSATTGLFLGRASDGQDRPVYDCATATLPVQIMLTIRGSVTDTGVVSLRLPIDDTTPGNANPTITGVSVLSPEPVRTLDETGGVAVPRDQKITLRVGVEQTQAEVYLDRQIGPDDEYVRDSTGEFVLGPRTESLAVFWYAEGGGFAQRRTGWNARDLDSHGQPLALAAATQNEWTTPKTDDYAATSSLVLVIVQDSRGGVAWTRAAATLESAP
jgi:hypothetical protein